MIFLGALIQVTCMFMLSLAQQGCYYQVRLPKTVLTVSQQPQVFLAQAVGSGLGQSLLFLPSLSILGHHFKARRSIATGIAVTVRLFSTGMPTI